MEEFKSGLKHKPNLNLSQKEERNLGLSQKPARYRNSTLTRVNSNELENRPASEPWLFTGHNFHIWYLIQLIFEALRS